MPIVTAVSQSVWSYLVIDIYRPTH